MINYRLLQLLGLFPVFLFLMTGAKPDDRLRKPVDTVGFATRSWQMDSVMKRIDNLQGQKIRAAWNRIGADSSTRWKVAICPHDDYAYAGWLYQAVLRNIEARTIILVGVAHKAKMFGLENRMVFGSFGQWEGPYGPVPVSSVTRQIMKELPRSSYTVHDSLHQAEHSLEALVPFLQYANRNVEIVPVLVPYMSFNTMDDLSEELALAIEKVMRENKLTWGWDVAMVISSDAVHYGDQDWGGQDYAPYGCDSAGYREALAHEYEIISNCLTGEISKSKIRRFTQYTVQDTSYRTYKWTWCGRYSVPFGLLAALHLEQIQNSEIVKGTLVGYGNSIMTPPIPVEDLEMGVTAVANLHHWVGYAAVGYR